MENDEDSQPLLNNVDNSRFTAPRSRFLSAFRTKTSDEACQSNDPSNVFLNFAEEEEESTEPDLIAAVFVVAFDTHCGKSNALNKLICLLRCVVIPVSVSKLLRLR